MGKENRFSQEVKERAVRLVYEQQKETNQSQWAIICSVSAKIGCTAEILEKEELKRPQRENREL